MRQHRVNHKQKGILLWNIGDRSDETFEPIWQIIKCWHRALVCHAKAKPSSRLAARERKLSSPFGTMGLSPRCANALGWKVYPMYIQPEDHLICQTYMTLS